MVLIACPTRSAGHVWHITCISPHAAQFLCWHLLEGLSDELPYAGLEFVRQITCAGSNTAKNPQEVTDVAFRKPGRQSSLDRQAQEEQCRRFDLTPPDWVDKIGFFGGLLTISGNNWRVKLA